MSDLTATNCGCSTDNGCGCNLLSGSFFFSPAAEMDLSAETTTDADAVAAETTAAG